MTTPHCPTHHRPLLCPSCVGAAGGKRKTRKKREAARENGKRGGRPRDE